MISELLREARLLSSELNKDGDPMAMVSDHLAATVTAERRFGSHIEASAPVGVAPEEPAMPQQLKRQTTIDRQIAQKLGSFEPGEMRTRVVGVCGMSCSGKSTVTATLRAAGKSHGSYVPIICLDDSYDDFMNDEPYRGQPTNFEPPSATGGRCWKNWDSATCINWEIFLDRLQAKIEIHKGYTPLIIIEGFLLLENSTAAAMCDHVVSIDIPKARARRGSNISTHSHAVEVPGSPPL